MALWFRGLDPASWKPEIVLHRMSFLLFASLTEIVESICIKATFQLEGNHLFVLVLDINLLNDISANGKSSNTKKIFYENLVE